MCVCLSERPNDKHQSSLSYLFPFLTSFEMDRVDGGASALGKGLRVFISIATSPASGFSFISLPFSEEAVDVLLRIEDPTWTGEGLLWLCSSAEGAIITAGDSSTPLFSLELCSPLELRRDEHVLLL